MWPDRVSNPGPLTYESGALPTALRMYGYQSLLCFFGKQDPSKMGLLLFALAPVTTAADDIHKYVFILYRENKT